MDAIGSVGVNCPPSEAWESTALPPLTLASRSNRTLDAKNTYPETCMVTTWRQSLRRATRSSKVRITDDERILGDVLVVVLCTSQKETRI